MDWQLTCRVCLETGDMVSLFDWDENNEQLSDKYTYCCGVKVTKNDSLPTLICLNCVDRLTYAYQFKQQCLSSNETLKECLQEFERSSQAVSSGSKPKETETITIKQENGLLLQYELPVEHEPAGNWSSTLGKAAGAVLTKAPAPRKIGRRRKYPNEQGEIDKSPYQRKKPKESDNEPESLTSLLASGSLELKQEEQTEGEGDQADDNEPFGEDFPDDDPEFNPTGSGQDDNKPAPRKRGRPRKNTPKKQKKPKPEDDGEDMLLRETIMAFSEPIPDHLLNPKPKKKYPSSRKRYNYGKTHTCETCGSSFTSNASLQAHIRRHLGIKPYVCSVCGYACAVSVDLRVHMNKHTGAKPYKCRMCDRIFGDTSTRLKHESICGYTGAADVDLRRHMRIHTGAKPFRCRTCNRAFRDTSTRLKHESVCGAAFADSPNLRAHMFRHTKERKLQCRHCDRVFVEHTDRNRHESVCGYACVMKEALKRHMLRHTGERPYKCRICERSFGDFGTRQKHERLHMGLRPYQCSLCGKSFTYSYVLSNHMLTHTGEKKYSCLPCNKKFTKAHHLKYHNKVHHKELYHQQLAEAEAKKLRQSLNNSTNLSGVLTGKIVDGTLHIVQANNEDGEHDQEQEQDGQMQLVVEEEEEDISDRETSRAVADIQSVVLDSEFSMEEEEIKGV